MTTPPADPSDQFVEYAQGQMDAIEDLIKGLPGIRGYVDKELRRDADKRLRVLMADQLNNETQRLLELQHRLLQSGGLASMDALGRVVTKVQTLADRIRTASYGYAGLFDPVRVREEQLRALHRFDVAMAERIGSMHGEIDALGATISSGEAVDAILTQLSDTVNDLSAYFDQRNEAILSPDLLLGANYAPPIDAAFLEAADRIATEATTETSDEPSDPNDGAPQQ